MRGKVPADSFPVVDNCRYRSPLTNLTDYRERCVERLIEIVQTLTIIWELSVIHSRELKSIQLKWMHNDVSMIWESQSIQFRSVIRAQNIRRYLSWVVSRCAKNILPLSKKIRIFQSTQRMVLPQVIYDPEVPPKNCELCEHPSATSSRLLLISWRKWTLVGLLECTNKFETVMIDERGCILSKESKKKVQRDRQYLITEAKKKKVINALVAFINERGRFWYLFIYFYVQDRLFTPNQFNYSWRLDEQRIGILHLILSWPVCKDRVDLKLLEMQDWKVALWKAMSTSQREVVRQQ